MSDEANFEMIRVAQPQKIQIPISNRFNKLTLSAQRRKNLMTRLQDKGKAAAETRRRCLEFVNDLERNSSDEEVTKPSKKSGSSWEEHLHIMDSDEADDVMVAPSSSSSSSNSDAEHSNFLSRRFANMSVHSKENDDNDDDDDDDDDEPIPLAQRCPSTNFDSVYSETRRDRAIAMADTQSMTPDLDADQDPNFSELKVVPRRMEEREERLGGDTESFQTEASIVILETDEENESAGTQDNVVEEEEEKRNEPESEPEPEPEPESIEEEPIKNAGKERRGRREKLPKVDISAKISIRIRVPSSSVSEEENDLSLPESMDETNQTSPSDRSENGVGNVDLQRGEVCTPSIQLTRHLDADNNSELFLSKSKSLLNQLYGRSWRTPEVISDLKTSVSRSCKVTNNPRKVLFQNEEVKKSSSSSSSLASEDDDKTTLHDKEENITPRLKSHNQNGAEENRMKDLNQQFRDKMNLLMEETSNRKGPVKMMKKINHPQHPQQQQSSEKKYGFIKSLDECLSKALCDPEAVHYRNNYKTEKEKLSKRLYDIYNEGVFSNLLVVPIEWNKKLLNTAGRCLNKKRLGIRSSVIELSVKVLTSADRLRCTLIHEMCHAAAWILNEESGHGAAWKMWVARANKAFPDLPRISVCHQYDIEYKYTYKCVLCGAKSQSHSKVRKVDEIRCKYCYGKIEVFLNKREKDGTVTPTPVKKASGFAKFVQDNYSKYKDTHKTSTHAEIMQLLSKEFALIKTKS